MREYDDLEFAVRDLLVLAGAIRSCTVHPETSIRIGDGEAEERAYQYVSAALKSDGTPWMPNEIKAAIHNELALAADRDCPACRGRSERSHCERKAA